ncbi:MAG: leucine-rich repeat domain-containing protein [bacterium]|nr:leucine-rich repeat domain-containing protein [bacterium]
MNKLSIALLSLILVGAGCVSSEISRKDGSSSETTVQVSSGKRIDLQNKNLTSLPSSALKDIHIEELDISGNAMTGALPSQIGSLKQLKRLDASNNEFTGIPSEVGQLQYLEELNFANNNLTGIPNELGNLKNLRVLDLRGNSISELDLNIIRAGLPSTTEILL